MKIKYIIIIFSIIIIFILLIISLVPSFIPIPEIAVSLRNVTIPIVIFISSILVCLIVYFMINYRLLSLLEREDWPALAYYLEQKIFVKGRYDARKVRLLASSYMVISDYASVLRLENKAGLVKPSVIEKNVLIFGSARILGGNFSETADFFNFYLERGRLKQYDREWVRWFYGFSNLLGGNFAKAEPDFSFLAQFSRNLVIAGLSAYFLCKSLARHSKRPDGCGADAEKGRDRIVKKLKEAARWKKETDKLESEIHAAIIRKYIDEAGKWLFIKHLE